jgi:hypothetical protein
MNVIVTGAQSGQKVMMVSGALNQIGDANRQWANCWWLAPSYALQLGDSGSLAIGGGPGPYQHVFGHFVGGSYWAQPPGLVHLYLQDLESCLRAGLNAHITI